MNLAEIDIAFKKYVDTKRSVGRHIETYLSQTSSLYQKIFGCVHYDNKHVTKTAFKDIVKKCRLSKNMVDRVCDYFKRTRRPEVLLHNIIVNPFAFVYMTTPMIISYDKACSISADYECNVEQYEKDKAWIHQYILTKNTGNSIYVDEKVIWKDYEQKFHRAISVNILEKLCVRRVFNNKRYYTSESFDKKEKFIADTMEDANIVNDGSITSKVDEFLSDYSNQNSIVFSDEQVRCLRGMITHNVFIVSGFPGVGKSTIVDAYCEFVNRYVDMESDDRIYVVAPTGMAVKSVKSKLENTTNVETSTIHKLIWGKLYTQTTPQKKTDKTDESATVNYNIKVLIVDESSMINFHLMHKIMKIVDKYECSVVFLGDENQLPPIGIGEPFRYFMNCKSLPKMHLTQIHRQKDSYLKTAIKQIIDDPSNVSIDEFDNRSIFFEDFSKKSYNQKTIQKIVSKYGIDEYNSKFISPSNKKSSGVVELNKILQRIYNPHVGNSDHPNATNKTFAILSSQYAMPKQFMVDDLILLGTNISNTNDVNGDYFRIREIGGIKKVNNVDTYTEFTIKKVDDKNGEPKVVSNTEMYDDYELGYCCTVHKTQGSQYDTIVIVMDTEHQFQWGLDNGVNLLYTAISRAKNRCIIIGDKKMFYRALFSGNDKSDELLTTINRRIDESSFD